MRDVGTLFANSGPLFGSSETLFGSSILLARLMSSDTATLTGWPPCPIGGKGRLDILLQIQGIHYPRLTQAIHRVHVHLGCIPLLLLISSHSRC